MISQLFPLLQPPMPICQTRFCIGISKLLDFLPFPKRDFGSAIDSCIRNTIINFDKPSRVLLQYWSAGIRLILVQLAIYQFCFFDFSQPKILLKSSEQIFHFFDFDFFDLPWNLPHLPGRHVAKHPLSSWSMASSSPAWIKDLKRSCNLSSTSSSFIIPSKSHCIISLHYLLLIMKKI